MRSVGIIMRIMSASAFFLGVIVACSSIERSKQIRNAQLAGGSTKSDVVNMIGLPAKVERIEAQRIEIWLYTGKPLNQSYTIIPVPLPPYIDVGKKNQIVGQHVILICVFDEAGRLLAIDYPIKGEQ